MPVRLMRMLGLQKADAPGEGDAEEERERQAEAVVRVKGDLRQQVGERDAQEHAGGEGQGAADGDLLIGEQPGQAE